MTANNASLGEVLIYQTADGRAALDVRLEGETVWLTQAQMVDLFQKTKQNISLHIRNIFREGEPEEGSVVKESLTTASTTAKAGPRSTTTPWSPKAIRPTKN